jgi:hypothetical protein
MSDEDTLFGGLDDDDEFPDPYGKKIKAKEPSAKPDISKEEKPIKLLVPSVEPFKPQPLNPSPIDNSPSPNPISQNLEAEKRFLFKQNKTKSLRMEATKIYDPYKEIEYLKEELRIKTSEINRLTMQLNYTSDDVVEMYKKYSKVEGQESSYHLAFLFSSPLVRKINTSLEIIMQLDYTNEIKNIEKHLKQVQHEIRYKVDVATITNFRSVITDAPFALHFTGHGVQNDPKALGPSYQQLKDKGDILLLEDENGMADYLFQSDLKTLVQLSKAKIELSHNYEVVFVSSCYSEFTANIFLASGARHVI